MSILDFLSPTPKSENNEEDNNISHEFSIFIVDDNEIFAKLIEYNLRLREKENLNVIYKFEYFSTGEECIQNLDKNPDVILLDFYLSGSADGIMNGDKVFKKIIEFKPTQKVVMLSGQEEANVVLSLIKMGLRNYIIKDDEMFNELYHVLEEIYILR